MPYPPPYTSIPALIAAYERGPDQLAQAVASLSAKAARKRPGKSAPAQAGKWSTLEVVAHLADSEQVYSDRIKRCAAMDKPLIIGFDEEKYAARLGYHDRDIQEELELIRVTRRQLARLLKTIPDEAWQRAGVHNERGLTTLEGFTQTATGHLIHHMGFIAAKRKALGI